MTRDAEHTPSPQSVAPEAPAREGVSRGAECKVGPDTKGDCSTRAGCDCPALTPRHEAPDWTAATEAAWAENNSHEAPADHHERNLTASNAELIEQALSHPPVEAPAEGAGEREEAFCEAYYQAHLDHAWAALRDGKPYQVNSDGAISLIQQAAADRRAVKAWQMTARSSAPEAREGEAVRWLWTLRGEEQCTPEPPSGMLAKLVVAQPLYTHPAAPSADKLRIAVEALEYIDGRKSIAPVWVQQRVRSALAALKAEGA